MAYLPPRTLNKKSNPSNPNLSTNPYTTLNNLQKKNKPENKSITPERFKSILKSNNLAPEKKATFIYKSSIELVDQLLKSPTAARIKDFKNVTFEIVDHILSNDQTSQYLLNIT